MLELNPKCCLLNQDREKGTSSKTNVGKECSKAEA